MNSNQPTEITGQVERFDMYQVCPVHVVVNDAGWRLVALDPDASHALVCGCPLLRALCDPPSRAPRT